MDLIALAKAEEVHAHIMVVCQGGINVCCKNNRTQSVFVLFSPSASKTGQTALAKFGKISIDYDDLTIDFN